jgi:hypothetical protein
MNKKDAIHEQLMAEQAKVKALTQLLVQEAVAASLEGKDTEGIREAIKGRATELYQGMAKILRLSADLLEEKASDPFVRDAANKAVSPFSSIIPDFLPEVF